MNLWFIRLPFIDIHIHIYIYIYIYQGLMLKKMEVSIQFWVPNLGLSPKYD